ncbi:MAG TPA: diadenylate cyclase CdaA [Bacteriovoracaceae bacterium]|nr:diadenylate cyclase CdaA [Bacteriovoracaceae bacterium]
MQQFGILLANFRLIDLLDMVAVALIIYRFLIIVQGTRAYQMLFGIVALAFVFWVSQYYELYALSWILQNFFDYLFIILIVLFQDQIRSALVSISSTRFTGNNGRSKFDQQIEEVVAACSALSRERTGALIVFEKNHGLLNYSSSGTRLDSRIHSDIIYSIFQTKSPLHDGAIIIYNGVIQAAGCFLPLSKNVEIDRHYGTRHRAALGITEISDAVVVTVSEETGRINICYNGVFHYMENDELLRKYLRKFLLEIDRQGHLEPVGKHI